jgi:hypothetical protein
MKNFLKKAVLAIMILSNSCDLIPCSYSVLSIPLAPIILACTIIPSMLKRKKKSYQCESFQSNIESENSMGQASNNLQEIKKPSKLKKVGRGIASCIKWFFIGLLCCGSIHISSAKSCYSSCNRKYC